MKKNHKIQTINTGLYYLLCSRGFLADFVQFKIIIRVWKFFIVVKVTFQKYLPGLNQGVMLKDGRKRFRETVWLPLKLF